MMMSNWTTTFAALAICVGLRAQAATNYWTGGGADDDWSTAGNWTNGAVPVSGINTWVQLDGTTRTKSVQDIATPFALNRLESLNGPVPGTKSRFYLGGGSLQFEPDGASQPFIYAIRQSETVISNDVVIPAGVTLNLLIGTYGLWFIGQISGGGGIDKLANDGGIDLRNGANSFSGGLTIRAANSSWKKCNVYASGAMGTGPVNLHGGTLATNLPNPGGLVFYNTTTHTNPVNLFQPSPIFAGLPGDSHRVTLSGPVDLNTNTLYLRGGGWGTLGGVIAGTGGTAIVKTDKGRWTLSASNTCTGAISVDAGSLVVDGAIDSAAVAVSQGATLGGGGSIAGSVSSAGTVTPGSSTGTLTVGGTYDQAAAGLLAIEIGGTTPGATHDVLAIGGAATLDGTLTVGLTNGFVPTAGNSFTVLTASAISGAFAATNLPVPGTPGLAWDVRYLAGAVVLHLGGTPPVTYVWTGEGTNDAWTTAENWTNNIVPVSASNTWVKLDGTNRLTTEQNMAEPFALNRLDILNSPAPGGKPPFVLRGGSLLMTANGPEQPRIYNAHESTSTITNAIVIPAGRTLLLEIGTYGLNFQGPITGGGGIDKLQNAGGIDLRNSGNTFSGGLTIRGVNNSWYKVNVHASGAMGTGPVNLHGGSLATNLPNPGGLIFYNTTTHTNPINLFQTSPIFAALPGAAGAVELTGPIDLNANTLHLRGSGTGTVAGVISEGAETALVKADSGRWTLAGVNTCTGAVVVTAGDLLVDGSIEATSVVVSNGATLGGSGGIVGGVLARGTIAPGSPAGQLTVIGSYTQAVTGTLAIELGGAAAVAGHDVLYAPLAPAALDGTLHVALTNGFAPAAGNSFTVLVASAISGTFAATNLPSLVDGLGWEVLYPGGMVVLSVTGVPTVTGFALYAQQIPDPAARGYQDDPDGDGFANLLEYVTGGDPTNADPVARLDGMRTNGVLALTFTRRITATDATLFVEAGSAATHDAAWTGIATNSAGSWGGAPNVIESGGPDPVDVTARDTDTTATNRFLRLRVTRP